MRIIAGRARGRRLTLPANPATRPLLEMARGALFNMLGPDIEGTRVLDLYAGSGAIGAEALSRGAKEAVFVERDSTSVESLKENLECCNLTEGATILKRPVYQALTELRTSFDYIFLDPPFADAKGWEESEPGRQLMTLSRERLAEGGTLIFRLEKATKHYPETWEDLPLQRDRTYGRSRICLYRAEP